MYEREGERERERGREGREREGEMCKKDVCVCEREREREGGREGGNLESYLHTQPGYSLPFPSQTEH